MRRVGADPKGLAEAAEVIRRGGVAAIPTDTLYGLAADPFNAAAIERLFAAKGRPPARALPLIASSVAQVRESLGPLPAEADRLAKMFWPGPLTLLVEPKPGLAAGVTAGTGRVGVRVPAHTAARQLCDACAIPLTATSANVSDEPATDDPDEVARTLGERVDILVDGGRTAGGPPSTIVDATGSTLRLVRPGAVPWDEVLACLQV